MLLEGHRGPVSCVDWSPTGKWLASVGLDQRLLVWSTGRLLSLLPDKRMSMHSVFSPSTMYLWASVAAHMPLRCVHIDGILPCASFLIHPTPPSCMPVPTPAHCRYVEGGEGAHDWAGLWPLAPRVQLCGAPALCPDHHVVLGWRLPRGCWA